MPTGTVKWFNATKGYGFIAPDDGGKDIFVHISAVERAGLKGLNDNQKIGFEMQSGRDGRGCAFRRLRPGTRSRAGNSGVLSSGRATGSRGSTRSAFPSSFRRTTRTGGSPTRRIPKTTMRRVPTPGHESRRPA